MRGLHTYVGELSKCKPPKSFFYSPICLCPVPRVQQILNRQFVKLFVLAQGRDHIPAETIYVNPAAFGPARLALLEERPETVIVEPRDVDVVLRKVDDGYLAGCGQFGQRCASSVCFIWIQARLGTRMPAFFVLELAEIGDTFKSLGSSNSTADWGARGARQLRVWLRGGTRRSGRLADETSVGIGFHLVVYTL